MQKGVLWTGALEIIIITGIRPKRLKEEQGVGS